MGSHLAHPARESAHLHFTSELRILDKLLYLHLVYSWNLIPEDLSVRCIAKTEALLSSMGLHEGHVQLKVDHKLSEKTQNLPEKVSMGGGKARRFLTNHNLNTNHRTLSHSTLGWEYWKPWCECTTNKASHPQTATLRAKLWSKLDAFIKLFRQGQLDDMYYERFTIAMKKFTQLMVNA